MGSFDQGALIDTACKPPAKMANGSELRHVVKPNIKY
jgi:hypothetical protein